MDQLAEHLVQRYGVTVERLGVLDEDVYRVDGPGWVARWLPAGADESAAATAELLRRLAPTRFPAERLAHSDPISVCGGRPVLVTEFVEGRPAPATARVFRILGRCLGGLHARAGHALPLGGGWHHLVPQGSPRDEIAAAAALLGTAEGDPAARATLLDELRDVDDGADLPHGIVHPDFVPANAILRPDRGMTVVDWAGCGRGPRLWSLGFLLWAAGTRDLTLVDAVVSGYREQVEPTGEELDRLPGAICGRPLTIDCWAVALGLLAGGHAVERLDPRAELAEAIADRVRLAIGTPGLQRRQGHDRATEVRVVDDQRGRDSNRRNPARKPVHEDPIRGELVTHTLDYDGGRPVTVYLPPHRPEAVVFAGDGQLIAQWGRYLETADAPPTVIVGAHRAPEGDEMARLREYSPPFDARRFAAHERFFVNDVRQWVRSRFGLAPAAERTAVYGVSASAELALALGLRHPDIYGAVFGASPGGGYQPPAPMPTPLPRTYLVAGTSEPFFLQNATRWANALRNAGADVQTTERVGNHGDPFWTTELPLMTAWAFGR